MGRRAASPTPSENEVDIAGSLFANDADSDNDFEVVQNEKGGDGFDLDFGDLLQTGGNGESGDDDEDFIASRQRSSNRKATNLQGKSVKKGGGFQAMGLNANLLRAITRKGFSVPTPIQRKAIPLVLEKRDVVGMARTGSGKTAAFVIPMIERLKTHSARVGARALILSPSRELALQTLKVVKELGRGTDLKTILLVGGDSLEEQFGQMASNPDIVIATPGRFLHLKVEMQLNLSSIKYVVFDEADRLFEMGFAEQLTEILHALPPSRQTLLFSATMPSSLVEFARAGLQEPSLVRLDAETKVSPDLESAFFSVKAGEKEGSLLHILHDVIKMPLGAPPTATERDDKEWTKKRKRGQDRLSHREKPTEHSTIIFTATKHHVEYIAHLLRHAGFAVSYVYGSLDQTARLMQVDDFRKGRTNILVVTDVAARGIDIPILANVINYDFPPQPKIFVHRVGRTARAGQRGRAYALVRESDLPYLLDLQLFLGRKLVLGQESNEPSFAQDVVVGGMKRGELENHAEWVDKVLREEVDISALKGVTTKAEKLYMKTRNSASSQSVKRAREIIKESKWTQIHPIFGQETANIEMARDDLLSKLSSFKPSETVFEIGPQGKNSRNKAAEVMRTFRKKVGPRKSTKDSDDEMEDVDGDEMPNKPLGPAFDGSDEEEEEEKKAAAAEKEEDAWEDEEDESDDDMEVTVTSHAKASKKGQTSFADPEIYMSYTPRDNKDHVEKAYGVHSGGVHSSHFVEAARGVAMDLTNDDGAKSFGLPTRSKLRWDKRHSKYVSRANDDDGSKGAKMVRGESGVKIAASFQSGRYDRWRKSNRIGKLPGVGEAEKPQLVRAFEPQGGARYKHKKHEAPKDADKFRDDYHVRKKRVAEAKENRVGKYKDGEGSKRELKNATDIRKARAIKEQKMEKNARPSKKAKRH